jgi:simple sugar transport system permease protein
MTVSITAAKSAVSSVISAITAAFLALVFGFVLLWACGYDAVKAYMTMFNGAFGSANRFAETIVKTVPLTIMALGTAIAFKSKIWNIGGNGQFIVGGILSLYMALNFSLPVFVMLPLTFLMAFAGGALWGGIAGYLKAYFNANEVITTLMLNYIASFLLAWLVRGPMMDPAGFGFPQTPIVDKSLQLGNLLPGTRLHFGFIIAAVIVFLCWMLWRSTLGFRMELIGESHEVAAYSGINVKKTTLLTMLISGGLAGLAGWNEIFGLHYRLLDDVAGNYGSIAIVIALLGGLHPLGIFVSAFFFSILLVGGGAMQRMSGIPLSLVDIIQGTVIIFVISRTALFTNSK